MTQLTGTELEQQIDLLIETAEHQDTATSVFVIQNHNLYLQKYYGNAAPETVFEWGSVTKLLTWTGIMQLAEEGKLSLDEDIRTYLPEHFLKEFQFDKPVTMLDLMNHTGGFQDSITNVYTYKPENVKSLAEITQKTQPVQLYEPGETVAYSNWGVTLAGYIIEEVSGESYIDYINHHIFEPLQMNQTSIDPLRADNAYVAAHTSPAQGYCYALSYPAAGAAGTAGDAARFMEALLEKSPALFQSEDTWNQFYSVTKTFADTSIPENAHGLWYDFYETPSFGHYGNTPNYSTHLSVSPETGTGFITMVRSPQEMKVNMGIGNLIFGEYNNTQTGENYEEKNFQENYVCARTIDQGYCRFYNYFNVYHVKQITGEELKLSSPMMTLSCNRIGEDSYLVDEGMLKGYQLYTSQNEQGQVERISTTTFDLIPYSKTRAATETISFCIAGAVFLALLSMLGIRMVKRIQKKGKEKKSSLVMQLLSLGIYLGILLEALLMSATTAVTGDMLLIILYYVGYLLAGLWYLIHLFRKKDRSRMGIVTGVCTFLLMCFILFWQMIIYP